MVDRNVLKTFRAGDVIMRQGDPGDCAYIIEKGRVEIVLEKAGEDEDGGQLVGTRGAGSMIGEMAIIDGAPRSAAVRALEDCEFLVITSKDFEKRLQSADPVVKMTAQVVLTRYRDTLMRANITGENSTWPPAELIEAVYPNMWMPLSALSWPMNYARPLTAVICTCITNRLLI